MFLSEETERPCSLALFIFRPPCAKIINFVKAKKNIFTKRTHFRPPGGLENMIFIYFFEAKNIFILKEIISVLRGPAKSKFLKYFVKAKNNLFSDILQKKRVITQLSLF